MQREDTVTLLRLNEAKTPGVTIQSFPENGNLWDTWKNTNKPDEIPTA
jgi:hypothetical protein